MTASALAAVPKDIASERLTLGCILQSAEALAAAKRKLRPSSFYLDAHAKIFAVALDLDRQANPVHLFTVYQEFVRRGEYEEIGGSEYLTRLVDETPTTALIEYAIACVLEAEEKRRYLGFFEQAIARIHSNGAHAETLRGEWRRDLEDLGILAGPEPATAKAFTQPLSVLLAERDEAVLFLVERLLVAGANGWVGGEPKSLKSWLALYLASKSRSLLTSTARATE